MNIESAVYFVDIHGFQSSIIAVIDGSTINVPILEGNRHYDEIMRQVEAGTLTIEPADEPI